MTAKWLVRDGAQEFIISADSSRVEITQCVGMFGTPVAQFSVSPKQAAKLARGIREAGIAINKKQKVKK